jgi:polysaccharide export outer membrane protein
MSSESVLAWRRKFTLGTAAALALSLAASAQNVQGTAHAVSEPGAVRSTATATSSPNDPVKPQASYVIGPGDTLSINVFNEPEVTGKVPVRPDGMITVPLVGDIQASGLTPDKLQMTITQKLAEYVKQPSVTVVVEEMNSRQFNVLGQVMHPGSFSLNKPTNVLDALAAAGGFNEFAKTSKIYVLRKDSGGSTVKLPFNYKRVSQGDDGQANVQLQTGDTVIVP